MHHTSGTRSHSTPTATAVIGIDDGGYDPDESSVVPHPRHQLATSISSILRMVALFLLVGGVTGAIVWRFDFRQPGALQGSGSGVVVAVMIGTVIAAAVIAALAFVVDLLFRIDWDATVVPATVEEGG